MAEDENPTLLDLSDKIKQQNNHLNRSLILDARLLRRGINTGTQKRPENI